MTRTVYAAQIALPDNSTVTVRADEGAQVIGSITGSPLDATVPGEITLTIYDAQGSATATVPPDLFEVIGRTWRAACNAADTRDRTLDAPTEKAT